MNDVSTAPTDLVTIDPVEALAIFMGDKPYDPILKRIRAEIDAFKPDLSTEATRKAIASVAYKVARNKTHIDDIGKELVAKQKEVPRKIDATRKLIRDTLDAWKDEVRKPLTDWEAAEDERIAAIKSSLASFEETINDHRDISAADLRERLAEIERESLSEQFYGDYVGAAGELKAKAIAALKDRIAKADTVEAERAELTRLRAADAERQAALAKDEAARKAQDETERALREMAEKITRETEAKAAAERAETEKRQRDKTHRAKINRAALAALTGKGIAEDTAKAVISLIAKGEVPHVVINY